MLADVTPDMLVAREEIFGPVITLMKYTDLDDAIAMIPASVLSTAQKAWLPPCLISRFTDVETLVSR